MRNGSDRPVIELRDAVTAITTGIFKGDPVSMVNGIGTVQPSTTTEPVYGICDGIEQYLEGGVLRRGNYLPVSTAWTLQEQRSVVRVILARDAVFEVQTNNTAGVTPNTLASWNAAIGLNADCATGNGSTVSGRSAYVLNIGTAVAAGGTASGQWRIVGFDRSMQKDVNGAYFKVQVELNESYEPQFSVASYA
jgi:hypothetical protein